MVFPPPTHTHTLQFLSLPPPPSHRRTSPGMPTVLFSADVPSEGVCCNKADGERRVVEKREGAKNKRLSLGLQPASLGFYREQAHPLSASDQAEDTQTASLSAGERVWAGGKLGGSDLIQDGYRQHFFTC